MRQVKVGSLLISPQAKKRIQSILDSNQISPGPVVREFEDAFSAAHGAKHGLFVNSGTDALRIALETLKEVHGWSDGDLVAVPAVTFVATVNVVLQCRLKPYFLDSTHEGIWADNMAWHLKTTSPVGVPQNLRAIIPVHLFGKPCDPGVFELAREWKLKVIEDSCEMMGVQPIQGDIACYSTYVCHMISTGVGGLAITNNDRYALIMRSYANHGRNIGYLPGRVPCKDFTKRFQFDRIGYSCRMTEMEAAIGIEQLKGLPDSIKRRREISRELTLHLDSYWNDLVLPYFADTAKHAFMMYPVLVKGAVSKVKKRSLCQYLEDHGIETRDLMPIVNQPCYKDIFASDRRAYTMASDCADNGFYIGCHPGMTNDDVAYVIKTFNDFFQARLTKRRSRVKTTIARDKYSSISRFALSRAIGVGDPKRSHDRFERLPSQCRQ